MGSILIATLRVQDFYDKERYKFTLWLCTMLLCESINGTPYLVEKSSHGESCMMMGINGSYDTLEGCQEGLVIIIDS